MNQLSEQTTFSFYTDEAIAGRHADRVAGCIERIYDATGTLAFGLDPESSPHQFERIELALECLRAELDFLVAELR